MTAAFPFRLVRAILVLLSVLVLAVLAQPALAERRVALVFGIDSYQELRPLANAVNDAVTMQRVLDDLGFEVFLETNRDLRRMRRALEDFAEDAAGADLAAVFFAGHGVEVGGRNMLLSADSRGDSPEALAASALPLDEVVVTLRRVAPAALVILDACRDDPFGAVSGGDGRGATPLARPGRAATVMPGLGRVGRADGLLFAFAAAPGATASDGTGGNSPFTEALARHLGTEGLEVRSALSLVQQEVYDRSRGAQLPYIESGLPQLVFAAGPATTELPERERLLLAMADLSPDLRAQIEAMAAARDMPLAPLYAAALSADLARADAGARAAQLAEAADAYTAFQADIRRFASTDPRVQALRAQAEEQVALGAFETARARLSEAAAIDAASREGLRETLIARSLSEAETQRLIATAARADLRYGLAIADYARAAALAAEATTLGAGATAFAAHIDALTDIAVLQRILGDLAAADAALTSALRVTQDWISAAIAANEVSFDAMRNAGVVVSALADLRKERGRLDEAAEYQETARAVLADLVAELPDLGFLRHDLFVAHIRAGDIAALRLRPDAALAAYDAALHIAVALVADFPENAEYQREVSAAHNRRGDLHLEAGRLEAAAADYAAAQALVDRLMAKRPADSETGRDRVVSLTKLAQTAHAAGDHAAALRDFATARDLMAEIVASDPDNAVMRRWLAVTEFFVGDAARALGDTDAARAAFEAGYRLIEPLARQAPDNVEWVRDLISANMRLGGLALETGDTAAAIAAHENELVLAEALLAQDPDNLLILGDRAYALTRLGTALAASGDAAAAVKRHDTALSVIARLRVDAGDPPRWQAAAASAQHLRAEALLALGDSSGALRGFERARGLRQALLEAGEADAEIRLDLIGTLLRLTELAVQSNRPDPALGLLDSALEQAKALRDQAPADRHARRTLAIVQYRIGEVQALRGDGPAARTAFAAAAELRAALAKDAPDVPLLWTELADSLSQVAEIDWEMGDVLGAAALLERAASAAVRGITLDPRDPNAHWVYLQTLFRQAVAAKAPRTFLEQALDQARLMEKQGMLGPDGASMLAFLRAELAAAAE